MRSSDWLIIAGVLGLIVAVAVGILVWRRSLGDSYSNEYNQGKYEEIHLVVMFSTLPILGSVTG